MFFSYKGTFSRLISVTIGEYLLHSPVSPFTIIASGHKCLDICMGMAECMPNSQAS